MMAYVQFASKRTYGFQHSWKGSFSVTRGHFVYSPTEQVRVDFTYPSPVLTDDGKQVGGGFSVSPHVARQLGLALIAIADRLGDRYPDFASIDEDTEPQSSKA